MNKKKQIIEVVPYKAKEYADLKIKLAQQFTHDRRGYVQNKQDYIKALEKRAIDWFHNLKNHY
jgi:GrpB-like predicted nucleotidyltransferase (UPF0157 family)